MKTYPGDDPDEAARKYHEATKNDLVQTLGVSEALRTKLDHFIVVGQIATLSTVYSMVLSLNLKCTGCKCEWTVSYDKKPKINIPDAKKFSCIDCTKKGNEDSDVSIDSIEWISALDIQLQDTEKFNSIERLNVRLLGNDTRDVIAGEPVSICGYRENVKKNESNNTGRFIPVLYAESIEYTGKKEIKLKQQDINEIEAWKDEANKQGKKILDLLVQKFCPTVIGHEFVKKSILIAVANAGTKNDKNRIPRRLRIHALVVGDPGNAKSVMMKQASELLPNGRFESATGSSGIGLTFTVTKEPNESYVLRLGALPLASGSICAINEMNQTAIEQQKHYLDFMEEGISYNNKYAIPATIIGHTTVIGSANPRGGKWSDEDGDTIELDEVAILPQVMDRFDIICVVRERKTDEAADWKFIEGLETVGENMETGIYDDYDESLKKYLMYARSFNPCAKVSREAKNMLYTYWVKMGKTDYRSRIRKLEALFRMAIAISKLKLKHEVDIEDADETMEFYNVVLLHFNRLVPVSESPKEVGRKLFMTILEEFKAYPVAFRELTKVVCERSDQIRLYLGEDFNIETNYKLRTIYQELLHSEHVILVQQKPIVFQWRYPDSDSKAKASEQASDLSDVSEVGRDRNKVENNENDDKTQEPSGSDTSDTSDSSDKVQEPGESERSERSDSPWSHLIITEDMPSVGKIAYSCKEHPDKWDTNLRNLEISHFEPFHKDG